MTEEIYQNLARNTDQSSQESIHLSDYPKIDKAEIDLKLIQRVDTLRKIVELGRSARNKAELKIRQPLAELCFHLDDNELVEFILEQQSIVLDELNVKIINWVDNSNTLIEREVKPNLPVIGKEHGQYLPEIKEALVAMDGNKILRDLNTIGEVTLQLQSDTLVLTKDAFLVVTSSKQGFTTESDGGITVGLTTELTDELVQEGFVRDVIRHVQIMRKNANFAVEDRINIYGSFDGIVGEAVRAYKDYLMNETLTINMADEFKSSEYEDTFKVGGVEVKLGIDRV
jgi:isoleucyl-tRNA synthetase